MANPLKELDLSVQSFQLIQEIPIAAPPEKTWKTLTHPNAWFLRPDAPGMKSTLELWPGGRWFTESPEGAVSLMAQVTLVEPGKLLRLSGPMGLSHLPIASVMIFELQPRDDGRTTLLRVGHRAIGFMDDDVKGRFGNGWKSLLGSLKTAAEKA
jgi:uncharacterized protein YndB with AHSA1/START domain